VDKYIQSTADSSILTEMINGISVEDRMEKAMNFLMSKRYSKKYGLLFGATTIDWGDIQPEHVWGVEIDSATHYAVDIYDNAMFLLAIDSYIRLRKLKSESKWGKIAKQIKSNIRLYLWDTKNQKFKPHLYLNGSPFPKKFNENDIHYHGGTAVAIQAGILSKKEIRTVNQQMLNNVKKAGGMITVGLTVYPPYPKGFFKNTSLVPYSYQNAGDWTWFGGRMIQGLILNGFIEEAYREFTPMIERVIVNKGFYEWYTKENTPNGSGSFRGEAGILAKTIEMFNDWANKK
jgi:hypothetical protein